MGRIPSLLRTWADKLANGESAIVVVPATVVTIMVAIPMMVVFEAAAGAVPIADEVAATFVAGTNPTRASVGRQGPIAAVPAIMMSVGIPIAINPEVVRARTHRNYIVARGRRRPDFNADADLGSGAMSTQQEH